MLNIDGLSSLATLSLEAFPSGDAIRRRAAEFSARMRLSGATDDELAGFGAAAERLLDPVGRFEESLRWLWLPEGTVRRVMDGTESWQQRLVGLREAVARNSTTDCRSHNEVVIIGLSLTLYPSSQAVKDAIASLAELSSAVTDHAPFWETALGNAQSLGDPRLVGAGVRSGRSAYQTHAFGPVMAPLQAELRSHQAFGACAALVSMVAAKLPERVLSDVRTQLFGDILKRCDQAIAELEPLALATKTKAQHEEVLRSTRDRLERDVSLLQQIGDVGGESCRRVRDAYAELMRTLAIRCVNIHSMHAEAKIIISRAQAIAAGSALRSRLAGDMKTLEENAAFRNGANSKAPQADGKSVAQMSARRSWSAMTNVDISVRRSLGLKRLGIGVAILAIGGVITGATYASASRSGGGYMVTTGLFLVGAINVLRGLWELIAD